MDYIEFKLWKLGALVLLAFVMGCFGLLPTEGRRAPPSDEEH
jgi:hypothetical protein